MNNFKKKIKEIEPIHDYPAGLVHPYWARKPLNIIEEIINNYTKVGDTVLDPFMGSGTTVFASLKNSRNIIGNDLNPISELLVKSILNSSKSPGKYLKTLKMAVESWSNFAINEYATTDDQCVEREFFIVEGDYKHGRFKLELKEAKQKPLVMGMLKGKSKLKTEIRYKNQLSKEYLKNPTDFSKIIFTENTRIAVHKGVKASDFFTKKNIVFINYAKQYIKSTTMSEKERDFLRLFLSSMIPLLRLSDRKASSQWPFWRPKKALTSRNPIVAIKRRYKSFVNSIDWGNNHLDIDNTSSKILQKPADKIGSSLRHKVDLILTDPPYSDHAPYLEYSDLYWSITHDKRTNSLWPNEIVKTNAIGRENDSLSYSHRMESTFRKILNHLKPNGYFIFFYLDKNITHWQAIKDAILSQNCITKEVISIPRQRKSMKTVMSPGKTLDGDLIIICKKCIDKPIRLGAITLTDALTKVSGITYFEKFSSFIRIFLTTEIIDFNAAQMKDISRII